MKVKFLLKNPKEGKNTIHVRVRIGRAVDLSLATKETTLLEDWDVERECLFEQYIVFQNGRNIVKRGAEISSKISENKAVNYRLQLLKKNIEDSYKSTSEKIGSEWLKNIVYPSFEESESKEKSFLDYCDVFIESRGTSISNDYITKVRSIQKIFERYQKYRKIKIIVLTDINNAFKNDFEKYCLDVENYSVNYFERNFKFIKTILYHAQQNGFPIDASLSKIKCRTEKPMFVILTLHELETIEKSNFSDEHLDTAKDWLIISCYCGQRISDFMRFDTSMITEREIKGSKRYFIEFVQEKTKKQILLPLNNKIIQILKKRNWSFPRKMSEARYNEHIKTVCEYVGIDELTEGTLAIKNNADNIKDRKKNNRRKVKNSYPKYMLVSSHIGRRSFASNNFGIIPTPYLMVATGHSSPNMLMKYIGKIDEQQSLALAEYLY